MTPEPQLGELWLFQGSRLGNVAVVRVVLPEQVPGPLPDFTHPCTSVQIRDGWGEGAYCWLRTDMFVTQIATPVARP